MQHTAEINERRVFLATMLADGVISKHDYCWYEKDKIQERSKIAGVFFFLIAKAALTIIYWRGKRVLCREPLPSFCRTVNCSALFVKKTTLADVCSGPVGNNLAADACAHASRQLRVCRPPAQKMHLLQLQPLPPGDVPILAGSVAAACWLAGADGPLQNACKGGEGPREVTPT